MLHSTGIPFGNYLCWIDYFRGILFCDVLNDNPQLWYVELPVKPLKGDPDHLGFGRPHPYVARSVCVSESGMMKFVNINRHDGEFSSKRKTGSDFTINTWLLEAPWNPDEMLWVTGGEMNGHELWNQDLYAEHHLSPEFPVVSMTEPHIVYAVLREKHYAAWNTWMLVIEMRI